MNTVGPILSVRSASSSIALLQIASLGTSVQTDQQQTRPATLVPDGEGSVAGRGGSGGDTGHSVKSVGDISCRGAKISQYGLRSKLSRGPLCVVPEIDVEHRRREVS